MEMIMSEDVFMKLLYTWYDQDSITFRLDQLTNNCYQFTIKNIFDKPINRSLPAFNAGLSLSYVTTTMITDILDVIIDKTKVSQFTKDYKPTISYLPDHIALDAKDFLEDFVESDMQDGFFARGLADGFINPMFADLILYDFARKAINLCIKPIKDCFTIGVLRKPKGLDPCVKIYFRDSKEFVLTLKIFRSVQFLELSHRQSLIANIQGQIMDFLIKELTKEPY